MMIRGFYLIKPRIILVNLIAVLGGFFFAEPEKINFLLLFYVLFGTASIIASSCIFNNIIDIDIDQKMFRTKKRILITSRKFIVYAKIIGVFLFFLSILILLTQINFLSCFCAILGFIFYVIFYTLFMKRISIHDIIVGSISGAIPPLIGYFSVNNFIDLKSILLFFICMVWQIPHSYSILILHNKDYKRAKIPTIVNQQGELKTLKNIMFYIFIFILLLFLFYIFHYMSIIYFIVLLFMSMIWFFTCYIYYTFNNDFNFSKLLFHLSIVVILIFHIFLITNFIFL